MIVKIVITHVLTYYFAAFIQAVLHKLFGHHNRIHRVYQVHAQGHHALYPPHRLLSEKFIDSEQHLMWYYAIPFVPIGLIVYGFGGLSVLIGYLSGLVFSIWWHIYLHEQYHLRNSFWGRFSWFKKKKQLHLIHHCHVHYNYAIVEFWIDRLMGSYQDSHRNRGKSYNNVQH